jgi:hypothetical protein
MVTALANEIHYVKNWGREVMKIMGFIKSSITRGLLLCFCFYAVGCTTNHVKSGEPVLSLVVPKTKQFSLDDIPEAKYTVLVKNDKSEEEQMEFVWPWYAAIGGKIMNESAVFERAAAGQIDQSMVLGMATRKYFMWSAHRAKAIRVANREQIDWNEIRKVLLEVAGEGTILTSLTPLPPEVIQSQVLRQNIPPELFITGGLTEVTVAEESVAAGLTFAGIGSSGKVVQTSVSGTIEITDPYTGEMIVSVMAQNVVTAEQVGAEAFRIVSFGGDAEYLSIELSTAREMIKQQVQVELVDYLFYKAFKELIERRSAYLTSRLHYRVGRIQGYAQELATKRGLTIVGHAVPIPPEDALEVPQPIIELPVPGIGQEPVDPNVLKETGKQLDTVQSQLQRTISGLEVQDDASEGPAPGTNESKLRSEINQKLDGKSILKLDSNESQIIEESAPDASSNTKEAPKAGEKDSSGSVLDRLAEVTGKPKSKKPDETEPSGKGESPEVDENR